MLLALAAAAVPASGQDIELEFSQDALNQLMRRLGDPSDGGVYFPTIGEGSGLFDDCEPYGYLECAGGTTTGTTTATPRSPTTGAGVTVAAKPVDYDAEARVPLSRCRRPNGSLLIVPAREAVRWQWWVTEARFTVEEERLTLSATVRARVNGRWTVETRTIPATIELDPGTQRLRLRSAAFKVPVQYEADGDVQAITQVDVSRLLSFSLPIATQALKVRRPDGSQRTINAKAQGANVRYLPGMVRVSVNVDFY